MLASNAAAQQGGLAMPCSHASFECNQTCRPHTICIMLIVQNHKKLPCEHGLQSVDKGEVNCADGCDPRQSISQSVSHNGA